VSLGTFARVGVWALFALCALVWLALCALVWLAPSERIEVLAVVTWFVVSNIMTAALLVQYIRRRRRELSNGRKHKS
jgi:cobalamin synthase